MLEYAFLVIIADYPWRDPSSNWSSSGLDDQSEHRRAALADDQSAPDSARRSWLMSSGRGGLARVKVTSSGSGGSPSASAPGPRLIAKQPVVALGADGVATHEHRSRGLPGTEQHLLVG